MEFGVGDGKVFRRNLKRKLCDDKEQGSRFPLEELNQDLLERVLSWLPTPSFFRLTSVCKRWKSVANSATFKRACSQVPTRDPCFFMVDSQPHRSHPPVVFDSSEFNWKSLNLPNQDPSSDSIPVAASGGLLCFLRDGDFLITNPITAACRHIKSPFPNSSHPIRAIAMTSNSEAFKLIILSGELPNLRFRQYNSGEDQWEEDTSLIRKTNTTIESETNDDDCTQYFLSKCGNVVSTDIQRSPSKQYSSVLTRNGGEEVLYFLSSTGTVVSCNLTRSSFFEYPRLLPVFSEYSIDLVEFGGQMYVVLLCEFLESASVRVWTWDDVTECWNQVAAMPPCLSHKYYGKKVDINCAGAGKRMLVCLNSAEICSYLMCDLVENEWVELPQCCINGEAKEFVCAFSFEPRIEASVWETKTNESTWTSL